MATMPKIENCHEIAFERCVAFHEVESVSILLSDTFEVSEAGEVYSLCDDAFRSRSKKLDTSRVVTELHTLGVRDREKLNNYLSPSWLALAISKKQQDCGEKFRLSHALTAL